MWRDLGDFNGGALSATGRGMVSETIFPRSRTVATQELMPSTSAALESRDPDPLFPVNGTLNLTPVTALPHIWMDEHIE
jgi:hypothetical protein